MPTRHRTSSLCPSAGASEKAPGNATVSGHTGGVTGAWSDVAHLGHAANHAARPRIHAQPNAPPGEPWLQHNTTAIKDPTRPYLGGASTRKQARRLDHNSRLVQPPGPRGAEDVGDKVHDAAATSTEVGLQPGSQMQGPTGQAHNKDKTQGSLSGRPGVTSPCPGPWQCQRVRKAPRLRSVTRARLGGVCEGGHWR